MKGIALGNFKINDRINFIVLALSIVTIVVSFYPQWGLWGLGSVQIFPVWIRFVILALMAIAAVPALNSRIGGIISDYLESLDAKRLLVIYIILSAMLVLSSVYLTSQDLFLGDGYTIIGNLKTGNFFAPSEPLDYLIHYILYKLIGVGEDAVIHSYLILSYLCGVLFLWGLYIFIKNKIHLIFSLAIITCFTVLQFFSGYVESYTFRFILTLFYCLSALEDYSRERLSPRTIILLCLAIAFHMSSAVLAPSAIYLAVRHYPRRLQYLVLSVSALLGLMAGLAYLALFSTIHSLQIMVPLWAFPSNPYTFISGHHLADLANLLLLNYPLLIVALLIGEFRRRLIMPFYLLLIGPALLFVIMIDPKLGAFRDWDLMSLAAAPVIVFFVDTLLFGKIIQLRLLFSVFAMLALFGFLHTGSWIIRNASRDAAYVSVRDAVRRDIHYSKDYANGHMNKSWAVIASKYMGDQDEVVRASIERYRGNPDDTSNVCQLANALYATGDSGRVLKLVTKAWPRFKGSPLVVSSFSIIAARVGHFDLAEQICYDYFSVKGEGSTIYYSLGNIKKLRGQTDSSYFYLDKAFTLNPDAQIERQFEMYLECFTNGYDRMAHSGFTRILPKLGGLSKSYASAVLNTLQSATPAGVDSLRSFIASTMVQKGTRPTR